MDGFDLKNKRHYDRDCRTKYKVYSGLPLGEGARRADEGVIIWHILT